MEEITIVDIPDLDGYQASSDGHIYRNGDKIEHRKDVLSSNYRQVDIDGRRETVHRLIATAFIPNPTNRSMVNHIDGNKHNNRADNLEWVTSAENAEHAFAIGLRFDNRPVKVFDHDTGLVSNFYSLNRAAEFIGVNPSVVSGYLNSPREYTFRNRWVIAWVYEDWEELLKIPRERNHPAAMRPLMIVGEDGESKMVFDGYYSLSNFLGIPKHRIFSLLNNKVNKTFKGWTLHYVTELDESIDVITRPKVKRKPPQRKGIPIHVINLTTGEERDWDSTQEFADYLGVKKNTIQKSILVNSAGDKSGLYKDFKITYMQ